METRTASLKEYTDGDSRDLEVVLVLSLKEGAPKVMKHYLKMLTSSTPPEGDMGLFPKGAWDLRDDSHGYDHQF